MDAAVHRISKLQRGYGRRPKAFKLHTYSKDTMGVLVPKHYMFRRGCVWKCEHVRWTPCRFSPPGALSAPKGEWQYTKATPSGAAPTSPPEGVFRHKRLWELVEQSGRTTGRLGYIRAYTDTRIRGPHYEPDYGPSYELHYGRYRSISTAMHAGPTTATAPPRRWTGRRTTLDTCLAIRSEDGLL